MKPLPKYKDLEGWKAEARSIIPGLDFEILSASKNLFEQIDEIVLRRFGLNISSMTLDMGNTPKELAPQLIPIVYMFGAESYNFAHALCYQDKYVNLIGLDAFSTKNINLNLSKWLGVKGFKLSRLVKDILNYNVSPFLKSLEGGNSLSGEVF